MRGYIASLYLVRVADSELPGSFQRHVNRAQSNASLLRLPLDKLNFLSTVGITNKKIFQLMNRYVEKTRISLYLSTFAYIYYI